MARPPVADVVIVGLGAAGAIACLELARHGLQVIGLEAGPRWSRSDAARDEIRNDVRNYFGRPKFNRELPTVRPSDTEQARASAFGIMANGVGGSTITYGGQCHRFAPHHFQPATNLASSTRQPDGAWIDDWPITYGELSRYYDNVEDLLGVAGQAGNIRGTLTGDGNPFEGPRSGPFPLRPLASSPVNDLASAAARELGWHPYPGPVAIHSTPYGGTAACSYCGFCTFNHCHCDAKASTSLNAIVHAEQSGHLRVITCARATEITVNSASRADGVSYVKDGELHHQPARAVILAGFTYENVRLMLVSTSDAFPDGVANNNGQVGKGYATVGQVWGTAVLRDRHFDPYSGCAGQHVAVADWDHHHRDAAENGPAGGGHLVSAAMEAKPIALARTTPPSIGRGWGLPWKQWIHTNSHSIARALGVVESFPAHHNFLDLDPTTVDDIGMPRLRVTYRPTDDDRRRAELIERQVSRWLAAMGASEHWTTTSFPATGARAFGGARMGTNPASSVVDPFGLCHEVPNLAVLGGATFPSAPGPGPTATIQALAWRTADRIGTNWDTVAV